MAIAEGERQAARDRRDGGAVETAGEGAHGVPTPRELAPIAARAVAAAAATGQPQIALWRIPSIPCDPRSVYAAAGRAERFFWRQPARARAIVGVGDAAVVEAEGPERFERVGAAIRDWASRTHGADDEAGPVFVGGFAFADDPGPADSVWRDLPPARWVLPAALVRGDGSVAEALVAERVEPGAEVEAVCQRWRRAVAELIDRAASPWGREPAVHPDPPVGGEGFAPGDEFAVRADRPHDVYRGQVARALEAIDAGALEKVVLARALDVRHPGRFDIGSFLVALERLYPHCTVLALGRGAATLVAASPELLLRHDGARVETCALAGSAPRGRTPEEDDALGRALQRDPKERAEHEAVVRAIREALDAPCEALAGPERPELMRVEGIQHLATPLVGRLRVGAPGTSALELVGRLHPTPAVGGVPTAAARDWIAGHEGLDRGWYAGPVGWVDARGRGELWVALRSALIRNAESTDPAPVSTARLFAGAGIVRGSEPDRELRETRLKLRALLAPLTEI